MAIGANRQGIEDQIMKEFGDFNSSPEGAISGVPIESIPDTIDQAPDFSEPQEDIPEGFSLVDDDEIPEGFSLVEEEGMGDELPEGFSLVEEVETSEMDLLMEASGMYDSVANAFSERWAKVMDDPMGEFQESIKPAALGAVQAINETIKTVYELGDTIADTNEAPQIPTDLFEYTKSEGAEGVAQGGVEVMSQFMTSYVGWGKVLKGISTGSKWTKAMLQGALADFSGMDAEADNVSKILKDDFDIDNGLLEALATNPDDPALLNRLRNAGEGGVLGLGVEGFVKLSKSLVQYNRARSARMEMDAVDDITGAPENSTKGTETETEVLTKEASVEGTDRTAVREAQNKNLENAQQELPLGNIDMPNVSIKSVSSKMKQGELDLVGGKTAEQVEKAAVEDRLNDSYAQAARMVDLDLANSETMKAGSDSMVAKLAEVTGIPKLYRGIGKLGGDIEAKVVDTMGDLATRPEIKLNSFGRSGKIGSEMINQAERNIKHAYGKYQHSYTKTVSKLSKNEVDGLREVMQGIKKPTTVKQKNAAHKLRQELDGVIKDSVRAGIYTAKQGAELLKKRNYWPRMTDETLLSTSKGKNDFIEAFSGKQFSPQQAADIMANLLHGSKSAKEWFETQIKKQNAGGKVVFSRDMAEELFKHRASSKIVERASHLEKARKLPQWLDETMNPFMIKDAGSVMSKYFDEVATRIESAKIFGKNDENYHRIAREITEESGNSKEAQRAAVYWKNTYATMVKDGSKSDYMTKLSGMKEGSRAFLDKADALQTYKLSLAQVLNIGQVMVNSPTYLGRHNNFIKSYVLTLKGMVKSFGAEGAEISSRSGAAAETIAMEMAGEATQYNKLFKVGPSPTQFLKWTGFTGIEKFNRRLAANIGKAYFEDLMGKKALIEAGKITGKKAAKINAALRELQIDPTVATKDMDDFAVNNAAETAAGAFSDKINFTNSASQMPLMWRHPYARLTRKFKTFMFHQGVMFKESVLKEAYKGNLNPMVSWLMAGPMIGLPIATVREWIVGDDKEYTNTEKLFKGYTTIGATGIFLDTMGSVTSGYGPAVVGVFAGPMGSDIVKWSKTAAGVAKYGAAEMGMVDEISGGVTPGVAAARTALQIPGGFPGKRALMENLKEENKEKNKPYKKKRKSTKQSGGYGRGY